VSNSVTCKNPKKQQASLFSFFFLCFQIGFSSFPLFRSASLFTDLFFSFCFPFFSVSGGRRYDQGAAGDCVSVASVLLLEAEWKGDLVRSAMDKKKLKPPARGESEGRTTLPSFWSWRACGWFRREGVSGLSGCWFKGRKCRGEGNGASGGSVLAVRGGSFGCRVEGRERGMGQCVAEG
jgi:hypothetical protein